MHHIKKISNRDISKMLYNEILRPRVRFKYHQCNEATISISPSSSIVTDRIKITGTGFLPLSPITIKARVHCDEEDIRFSSHGYYVTSGDGTFDIDQSTSSGGSYTGVDGMGLFWSMKPDEGHTNRFQITDATRILNYEFSVYDGHIDKKDAVKTALNDDRIKGICSTSHKRTYLAQGIKREEIREPGLTGTLFVPPGDGPFPAIVTLYGGIKKRKLIDDAAAMFANQGFVALNLAYFGFEGLPSFYAKAPVRFELFERGFDYLSSLEYVNSDALGVYGISKGGEISVGLASLLPQVKAAVCVNGWVASVWSDTFYKEHHFPRLGFDRSKMYQLPDKSYVIKEGAPLLDVTSPSTYPFHKTDTQMLLICGLDDQSMPGDKLAEFFKETMKDYGRDNFEVATYEGLGHLIDAPYAPPCTKYPHSLLNHNNLDYGGNDIEVHSKLVIKVWEKVIGFFKQYLKT